MVRTMNTSETVRPGSRLRLVVPDGSAVVLKEHHRAAGTADAPLLSAEDMAYREGHEKGVREGREAALAESREQIRSLEARLADLTASLPPALAAYADELETRAREEVCDLAFDIAGCIIGRELTQRPIIRELAESVLSPILGTPEFCFQLSPDDAAWFKANAADSLPGIEVVADPALQPGDALVRSPKGLLDATLKGRLETLKAQLKERLHDDPRPKVEAPSD